MSRGPRIFIAIIVALIIAAVAIKKTNTPPEVYMPPPHLYQNATEHVHGYVTGFEVEGYDEHLLEGSADFYYFKYKFQPKRLKNVAYSVVTTEGKTPQSAAPWYTGEVRMEQNPNSPTQSDKFKIGQMIVVAYDPLDPNINGVPDSLGVWSKTTGYWNGYLWWYVAFAAVVFVIQELVRMATKTNDLGYS